MADIPFDSLDALPEAMRPLAVSKEGKFVLTFPGDHIPGYVPKAKHDEFRETNITLAKERDELRATVDKFKDIDPAKARQALDTLKSLDQKRLIDAGEAKKVEDDIRAAMAREKDDAVAAVATERDKFAGELRERDEKIFKLEIDNGLAEVFADAKLGLRPRALRDAKDAARLYWKPKDGKLVPHKEDGSVDYNGNGEPKTLREWVESQAKERDWKQPSSGAGGFGTPAGGGFGGVDLTKLSVEQRMNLGRRAA